MINKTVKKIHRHRISFLVLISFLFLAYLGMNPIDISKYFGAKFGSSVGMSVGVPENPINKLAMQLKEKEEDLNERERALADKEAGLVNPSRGDRMIIWIMGLGIITLFILILVNFYLDRRYRKKKE
jgi:hypothetical protein